MTPTSQDVRVARDCGTRHRTSSRTRYGTEQNAPRLTERMTELTEEVATIKETTQSTPTSVPRRKSQLAITPSNSGDNSLFPITEKETLRPCPQAVTRGCSTILDSHLPVPSLSLGRDGANHHPSYLLIGPANDASSTNAPDGLAKPFRYTTGNTPGSATT
ncbi:hypothetical protein B296_00022290 [Ensete ventricosum]|uniref:Uncharacterized protein n=1 Tax=Ensete ventricosum TaxID=4639 RepID=A0A426ZJP8_ENSVE|nr:hypothetical protein B296_00022290 [Ensete ventricosum]